MSSTPHETAPTAQVPPRTAFWDWLLRLDLRRSDDRWLGGVAAGLAERLRVDPVLIRVVMVVVALLGGTGLVLYAAAWLLLPDRQGRIEARAVVGGEVSAPALLALGMVALATVVPEPWSWVASGQVVSGGDVVTLVVVGTLLAVAVTLLPRLVPASAGGARPDGAPVDLGVGHTARGAQCTAGHRVLPLWLTSVVLGVALLVGVGAWVLLRPDALATVGVTSSSAWTTWTAATQLTTLQAVALAVAAGTAVTALWLVGAGLAGRRSDGLGFWATSGAVAAVLLVAVPATAQVDAVSRQTWRPASVAQAERGYAGGVGETSVDLRALPTTAGTVEVPVRHGIGQVLVLVPDDADVVVRSRTLIGGLSLDEPGWVTRGQSGGFLTDATTSSTSSTSSSRLVVDVQSGIGDVEIRRSAA